MLKIILGALGLIIIVGGAFYFLQGNGDSNAPLNANAVPLTLTQTNATDTAQIAARGASSTTPTPAAATTTGAPHSALTTSQLKKIMQATLHTNMGDIILEFYPAEAPKTVENFIKLASSGFYDKTKFHRVIKGFMDQGGDPLTKDDSMMANWGTGGPGYAIPDEITPKNSNTAGTIAMANSGPNSAGSQFFINAVNNPSLNGGYTVFGRVTAGMDVVTAINQVPTVPGDRPVKPVVLESITLK